MMNTVQIGHPLWSVYTTQVKALSALRISKNVSENGTIACALSAHFPVFPLQV